MFLKLQQWPLGQIQQISSVNNIWEVPNGEPVEGWYGTSPREGWFRAYPCKFYKWKIYRDGRFLQEEPSIGLWAPSAPHYYAEKTVNPVLDRIFLRGRRIRVLGGIPIKTYLDTIWVSKSRSIRVFHLDNPGRIYYICPEGMVAREPLPSEKEFLVKRVRAIYQP